MVLLSEKPEYNHKIRVASLLAPVGYKSRVDIFSTLLYALPPVLKVNLKWNIGIAYILIIYFGIISANIRFRNLTEKFIP